MLYILENATKTISNLRKLDEKAKNHFKTKLRLENNSCKQKLQQKQAMSKDLFYCDSDLSHWPNVFRK